MRKIKERKPLSEGEREAFHELYQTHHRRVYSICLRMTQNISEAEDLTQEIFIHLFRNISSFRGDSAFTTWLHRLTVNHVLMHFRKRKARPELIPDDVTVPAQITPGTNDPTRMRVVDGILLSEIIAKLPPGYREAVVLHDIAGLQHNEIAAMKGKSIGTSKSQLHKAREMLRQLIVQTSSRPLTEGWGHS